jgi:hypothetical protein
MAILSIGNVDREITVAVQQAKLPELGWPRLALRRGHLIQPVPAFSLGRGQAALLLREESGAGRARGIMLDISRHVVVSWPLVHHRPP